MTGLKMAPPFIAAAILAAVMLDTTDGHVDFRFPHEFTGHRSTALGRAPLPNCDADCQDMAMGGSIKVRLLPGVMWHA
jgi:hypothetical protein